MKISRTIGVGFLVYFSLAIIWGCDNSEVAEPELILPNPSPSSSLIECPEKPTIRLNKEELESLSLGEEAIAFSNVVNSEQNLGYKFYGRTGKIFNYVITSNVCIWIFSPDTKLLQRRELIIAGQGDSPVWGEVMSIDLPLTGEYVIQVSTPQDLARFQLEMNLLTPQIPQPSATPQPAEFPPPPAATPTPNNQETNQQEIIKESPEEAVKNYYANLNEGEYKKAWTRLSSPYQNDFRLHPDGYSSYESWWQSVEEIELVAVNEVENNGSTASVNSSLNLLKNSGETVYQSLDLLLVWDAANNQWNIDAVKLN
ncbi:MAG: hypothetical protein F6K35_25895 [Okeania sp. SIO2H7]|nr:hypothetical protein [Okeania sp. SIO2H7]